MSRRFAAMRGAPRSFRSRGKLRVATASLRRTAFAQARGRSIARLPAASISRQRPGGELKAVDYPLAATDVFTVQIDSTPSFQLLNGIQVGAAYFNRVGKRIKMKSVHIIGNLVASGVATGAGTGEYLRLLLVYDRQTNGNVPVSTDVLGDRDNQGAAVTTSFSKQNLDNSDRFAILRDWRVAIPQNGTGGATQQMQSISGQQESQLNWFVKLNGLETVYKSSTNPAAIGDIATGSLLLMAVGSVAAGSNGYAFVGNSRLRFYD